MHDREEYKNDDYEGIDTYYIEEMKMENRVPRLSKKITEELMNEIRRVLILKNEKMIKKKKKDTTNKKFAWWWGRKFVTMKK